MRSAIGAGVLGFGVFGVTHEKTVTAGGGKVIMIGFFRSGAEDYGHIFLRQFSAAAGTGDLLRIPEQGTGTAVFDVLNCQNNELLSLRSYDKTLWLAHGREPCF